MQLQESFWCESFEGFFVAGGGFIPIGVGRIEFSAIVVSIS